MRKKKIFGNWKMNGSLSQTQTLLNPIVQALSGSNNVECAVFPPAIYLPKVSELLKGSAVSYGAQNVYPKDKGAFTGELSAAMLNDFHCKYVLVGHSERRQLFYEDENFISEKFHHVKEHDMIPVLCVGETMEEREKGMTEQVLLRQLLAVTKQKNSAFDHCIIAYEPVWAIGTGQTATPEQAQGIHEFIRAQIAQLDKEVAHRIPILYGGSVNEKNAQSLFAMSDIDGGLVGGASLNAQQFLEIVQCIN